MLKLYKDTIKITNDNIILATPLILFMWLLSLYLSFAKNAITSTPTLLLSFITTIFMVAAFFAGWFYMVKKAVKLSKQMFVLDSDKAKATFNLIKTIPSGIGKYFLSFIGLILISVTIFSIVGILTFKLGLLLIGEIGLDAMQIKAALANTVDMKAFLDSLTLEQLIKLNNWNLLILSITSFLSFLFMLWIPEIVYKTRNPFMALINSIGKIFCKPWKAIKLFIFITVLNFVLSLLNTFSFFNPLTYFILLVLYFYFLVYLVVLIFTYYDREFEEQ